jgi:hypothetical protein
MCALFRVGFQAQDEVLYQLAEEVKNFAVVYLVDITETPDFNQMYELYDPCTVMFFFRNKSVNIASSCLSWLRTAALTRERFCALVFGLCAHTHCRVCLSALAHM